MLCHFLILYMYNAYIVTPRGDIIVFILQLFFICSCVFDLIKFNFHIYWDIKIVSWFRQCKMLMYLIPFLGLLKILDKEHHFIMPIINENTLIIKNDKCKKKTEKPPRNTPKSSITSKYILSTNGFMDIVEQKIPPSLF